MLVDVVSSSIFRVHCPHEDTEESEATGKWAYLKPCAASVLLRFVSATQKRVKVAGARELGKKVGRVAHRRR